MGDLWPVVWSLGTEVRCLHASVLLVQEALVIQGLLAAEARLVLSSSRDLLGFFLMERIWFRFNVRRFSCFLQDNLDGQPNIKTFQSNTFPIHRLVIDRIGPKLGSAGRPGE